VFYGDATLVLGNGREVQVFGGVQVHVEFPEVAFYFKTFIKHGINEQGFLCMFFT
jgi:hypothetical protein